MTRDVGYRMTRSGYDVVSTFGCLWASELPASIIVDLLVERGYTPSNARNQLARLALRGLLQVRKVGRQSVYEVSEGLARHMGLASGRQDPPPYQGHLYQLVFEIPETERWFKDRLVTVAEHHGYGRLRSGVLLAVADRCSEVLEAVGQVPDGAWLTQARLVPADLEQARALVRRAFDTVALQQRTDELARAVDQIIRQAEDLDHVTLTRRYFDVHHRATDLVLQAPALPTCLVDGRAVGERVSRLLEELAVVYLRYLLPGMLELVSAHPSANLVVRRPDLPQRPAAGHGNQPRPDEQHPAGPIGSARPSGAMV